MNLEEVKAFLEQNKSDSAVQEFVRGLNPVTLETVKNFAQVNDEAKNWLQSQKDSHFSTSLETWKKNNLDEVVMSKVKELYPEESEEQKRIRMLEQKLLETEQKGQREALKNKAISVLGEKKLPASLVDFFIGEDEDKTLANIALLEENYTPHIEALVNQQVEERFKGTGRQHIPGTEGKVSVGSSFAQQLNQQSAPATGVKSPWDN